MTLRLGWIDLAVLVAYLASAVAIGLKVSGKSKNLEAYLLGDRNLPWWAILGSIVATETSTVTVLSVPAEAYGPTGLKFLQLALGYIAGRAMIVRVLLPLYFRGQLFTAYQVLEQRFGGTVRRAASLLFLLARNLGDGLRLFLAAIVLHKLAAMPLSSSVVIMGAVTIVYTFFGGMRSVVWNDCLQFLIYMAGAVAAVFVIAAHVDGGWAKLWAFAAAERKLEIFDFSLSLSQPYTFWAGLIGGAVLTIGTHGADHMMVQRYLSARSQRDAGRAVFLSGVVVFLQFAVFLFIGVELACYYGQHASIKFEKADEVFAHFIVHIFPQNVGLVGLLLAAILAAAMSTLSSSLNSSASALVNDFYLPWRKGKLPEEQVLRLTRWLTVVFGVVQIAVGIGAGLLTTDPKDTVVNNVLAIAGFTFGLLLGVFMLGVLSRRAGAAAAMTGGAAGLAVLLAVKFVAPSWGITIAFPWLPVIGAGTTFIAGFLMTFVFPQPEGAKG